jgi:flagellar FliJ protein
LKRFQFRFQRILEIKERIEEVQKIALGEVVAVLNQEQDRLDRLEKTRTAYRLASSTLPVARLDPSLLGINESYLLRLQREILEQRQRLAEAAARVEKQRAVLVEVTKQRRVYETLKESAVEEYEKESKRQERIELDEIGGQLYSRGGFSSTR